MAKSTPGPDQSLLDGARPSKNLAEILAIDTLALMRLTFPELVFSADDVTALRAKSITARMSAAGQILQAAYGLGCLDVLHAHASDTVRGWAPYVVGAAAELSLTDRIELVRPSADDDHFGVREWAWFAIRLHIASNIEMAIGILEPTTKAASSRIRRFATEATRPRGVWAMKIQRLVDEPELGLPLLEPLRADPEKYVQDSVANWINDASKSKADWARKLCARWGRESGAASTKRICSRAMRTLTRGT
jgi:3-methyladenine DNA glycosylase AlkC